MGQEWHLFTEENAELHRQRDAQRSRDGNGPSVGRSEFATVYLLFFILSQGYCVEQYVHLLCGVCNMSKHVSPISFAAHFSMKHAQCRARGNNVVWDYLFDVFLETNKRKVSATQMISLREFMLAVH